MKTSSNYSTCQTSSNHEEIKIPLSSRYYKGIVPQHNGRWGAQIYEGRRRIWLGTFHDETEAARAYDIAAQRFRGSKAVTNFKCKSKSNPDDQAELAFLLANSKEEIVDMLRKHTYNQEFKHSLRKSRVLTSSSEGEMINFDKSECTYLFHKVVKPSDVGKLNRLVIPKIHAMKYFQTCVDPKGVLFNFEDGEGKMWKFRYSYWKGSHNYVLTKGWNQYVKEKGIKAGDVVSFWKIPDRAGFTEFLIDCKILKNGDNAHSAISKSVEIHDNDNDYDGGDKLVVRLFGVDICKGQGNGSLDMDKGIAHKRIQSSCTNALLDLEVFENGKRRREMER
ncbi:hypothetical protein LUZ60_012703 [Juncus effusus]|nr:hypothetical protein LUZ60_012703 [Juncus effusus]